MCVSVCLVCLWCPNYIQNALGVFPSAHAHCAYIRIHIRIRRLHPFFVSGLFLGCGAGGLVLFFKLFTRAVLRVVTWRQVEANHLHV